MTNLSMLQQNQLSGAGSRRSLTFFAVCMVIVVVGYIMKERHYIDAGNGLGYWLGISGGLMMLALLAYPLQKRFRLFKADNSGLKNWFMLHMLLGIIGPLLILLHCNFSLGSTNSNVALYSMLAMVSSGFIGRFLYAKTHYGLYGKLCTLHELLEQTNNASRELATLAPDMDHDSYWLIRESLYTYQASLKKDRSALSHIWQIFTLGWRTRATRRHLNKLIGATSFSIEDSETEEIISTLRRDVTTILATTRRAAELGFYRKLFSLWHIFHLPIFIMLLVTGFIHVYAVHSY